MHYPEPRAPAAAPRAPASTPAPAVEPIELADFTATRRMVMIAAIAIGVVATEQVARRGFHVSREYAIDELEILFVRDVMNTDIVVLAADEPVADAVARIAHRRHDRSQHLYPVLDRDASLVAAASYAELMAWAADPARRDLPLGALTGAAPPPIFTRDTRRAAVARMAELGVTRLLAVNPADARHVVGKIALHDLLKARAPTSRTSSAASAASPVEYLLPPWLRTYLPR